MKFLYLWLIAAIIFLTTDIISQEMLIKIVIPFVVVLTCVFVLRYSSLCRNPLIPYIFFFAISITSFFGLTETLTGAHQESTNNLLFGLSFYTASIAYCVSVYKKFSYIDAVKVSNPLLLITGPVALFVLPIRHKRILNRMNYYLPFCIIGIFFYQIIAAPLTEFFYLINSTDLVSSLIFAIIFEIFVYTNFCGLSLIVYGTFGVLGYRIPLNFKQPFSCTNIIDFWKGWHRSLSVVLKTLFYKPLRKRYPQIIALLGVYLGSALWHGVTFNFVIWGIFHTLMFYFTLAFLKKKIRLLPTIFLIISIVIGRLIFADSDTDRLLAKLLFDYNGLEEFKRIWFAPSSSIISLFIGIFLIAIEFLFQKNSNLRRRNYKHLRSPIVMLCLVVIGILLINETGVDYAVYGQR